MSAKKINVFWFCGYWGCAFVETDIPNTYEGGYCWTWAKIRPRWYWWIRRMQMFLEIVWRPFETSRIDWRTAWDVSKVARGLSFRRSGP